MNMALCNLELLALAVATLLCVHIRPSIAQDIQQVISPAAPTSISPPFGSKGSPNVPISLVCPPQTWVTSISAPVSDQINSIAISCGSATQSSIQPIFLSATGGSTGAVTVGGTEKAGSGAPKKGNSVNEVMSNPSGFSEISVCSGGIIVELASPQDTSGGPGLVSTQPSACTNSSFTGVPAAGNVTTTGGQFVMTGLLGIIFGDRVNAFQILTQFQQANANPTSGTSTLIGSTDPQTATAQCPAGSMVVGWEGSTSSSSGGGRNIKGTGLVGVRLTCSDGSQQVAGSFSATGDGGSMSRPQGYTAIGVGSGTLIDRIYDPNDASFNTFIGNLGGDITLVQSPAGLFVTGVTIQGSNLAVGVSFIFGPQAQGTPAPVPAPVSVPVPVPAPPVTPSSTPTPTQTGAASTPLATPASPASASNVTESDGLCATTADCVDPGTQCQSGVCLPNAVDLSTFQSLSATLSPDQINHAVLADNMYQFPTLPTTDPRFCGPFTVLGQGTGTKFATAFGIFQYGSHVVLAFRGTSNSQEAGIDLVATLAPCSLSSGSCRGNVHAGFLDAYTDLKAAVTSQIQAALKGVQSPTFSITGHSFGGALAILATFDLQTTTRVDQMFTFGAPRVGDSTFEANFQVIRTTRGTRSRFVQVDTTANALAEADYVTKIPPKGFGFADPLDKPFAVPCTAKQGGGQCNVFELHNSALYAANMKADLRFTCSVSNSTAPAPAPSPASGPAPTAGPSIATVAAPNATNASAPAFSFPLDAPSNVTTVGADVATVSICTASGLGAKRRLFRRDGISPCLLPAIITTKNCDAVQSQVLQTALAVIRSIIPSLISNLTAIGTSTQNPAVKAYFVRFFDPDVSTSNVAAVKSVFQTLTGAVVNAVCEVSCPSGVEAYVDPPLFRAFSSKNKVHLCAPFFELDASSLTVVDRKAGTFVHEMTHLFRVNNQAIVDAYGESSSASRDFAEASKKNPDTIINADNYRAFLQVFGTHFGFMGFTDANLVGSGPGTIPPVLNANDDATFT